MNVIAIVQARMTSQRLPGKVVKNILGKPMILHLLERVMRAESLDQIILATSDQAEDDVLVETCREECAKRNIEIFRGPMDDVLERYYLASQKYRSKHIVRITGDCPIIDPVMIDNVVNQHLLTGADYTTNFNPPTFPDGLDTEVIKTGILEQSHFIATDPYHREHVTAYVVAHREQFKMSSFFSETDLSHLRWTVDEQEDFDLITNIFERLYPANNSFDMHDVLRLMECEPNLITKNSHYKRRQNLPLQTHLE